MSSGSRMAAAVKPSSLPHHYRNSHVPLEILPQLLLLGPFARTFGFQLSFVFFFFKSIFQIQCKSD